MTMTDAERESLSADHSLARDADGNDVLVGLTLAESADLLAHRLAFRPYLRMKSTVPGEAARLLELQKRHEAARLEALGTAWSRRQVLS